MVGLNDNKKSNTFLPLEAHKMLQMLGQGKGNVLLYKRNNPLTIAHTIRNLCVVSSVSDISLDVALRFFQIGNAMELKTPGISIVYFQRSAAIAISLCLVVVKSLMPLSSHHQSQWLVLYQKRDIFFYFENHFVNDSFLKTDYWGRDEIM